MDRRALLSTAVTIIGAGGMAGCSRISGFKSEGTVLGAVSVQNYTNKERKIHLEIDRDGTEVLSRTITIEAFDSGYHVPSIWITPTWPASPAIYTFRAKYAEKPHVYEQTFSNADKEEINPSYPCLPVEVKIGSGGGNPSDPAINFWPELLESKEEARKWCPTQQENRVSEAESSHQLSHTSQSE